MAPILAGVLFRRDNRHSVGPYSKTDRLRIAVHASAILPASLVQQPALPAAQPDFAVLGGQHRAWALRRRARAADDIVLRALDRRLLDAAAVPAAGRKTTAVSLHRLHAGARGRRDCVAAIIGQGINPPWTLAVELAGSRSIYAARTLVRNWSTAVRSMPD
jgi:hypothetical protein